MASLSSLLNKTSLDDHEAILAASESALKASTSDKQAQHAKAVALLKLERDADALKHFDQYADLKKDAAEIYAYCLYRSGKYEEATKLVSGIKGSRGAQHIGVQAAYRAEDWDTASTLLQELTKEDVADESFDLRVKKIALDTQGLWLGRLNSGSVARATTDDLSSFETAYNAACVAVAKGQLAEADILLKRAVSLCEHHEELSAQEKETELVPLKAQRIFVLNQLGKQEEAQNISKEIENSLGNDFVDKSTQRLARNNVLTASARLDNPFLAHKFYHDGAVAETDKLFSYQLATLKANEKAVDLETFKYDGLSASAKKTLAKADLPSTSPDHLLASMFDAAAKARNEVGKAAINKVLPELENRPNDVGLILTLVQMYILTGNTTAAIELIESFFKRLEMSKGEKEQDVRHAPGLISCLVSLYRSQGRRPQMISELAKAASYWRSKSKPPASLLQAAGFNLLNSSNDEDLKAAAEIFDTLYQQQPNDKATVAGYIASHASDTKTVQPLAKKLTPVAELIAGVDVSALEVAGIPQSANAIAIAQAGQGRKRAAAEGLSSQKKRIRKSRMPKNYDPKAKPDPERWLPLRDRSTYRPKGKKKAKKDDRTQGGGNVNESLDISNRPAGAESTSGGAGAGGGKKKKGKGKK